MAFSSISDLWNKWNIRVILILSLSLQVFLILCAPLRKKILNPHIIFLLWLAYLMADWVAAFGIGLISHSQGNLFAHATHATHATHAIEVDRALQALWASFLLLHLGGPDTITAFSIEDSSLWRRHLLSLIFQVGVAIYVFVQKFAYDKSLVIPTTLVFLAGVIKNVERTLALYLSSLPRLRKSMMLMSHIPRTKAYLDLVEELKVLGREYSNEENPKLADSIVVKHAYFFFERFQCFISDLIYRSEERRMSRRYFHKVSAVDALRVISVELHFMYELLHTKVLAIRSKWSYIFRFIAFTKVVMAFILFNRFKKDQLPKLDVAITYILLFGGIALDVTTLLILVFSDWTIARIMLYKTRSSQIEDLFLLRQKMKLCSFLQKLISVMDDLRKPRFSTCKLEPNASATYTVLDTPFILRRWSESISACNIFSEIWKESPRKMYKCDWCWGIIAFSNICSLAFHMTKKIISLFHQTRETFIGRELSILETIPRYTSKNPFINKRKSICVRDPKEAMKIFEARGDLFLRDRSEAIDLLEYVTTPTYDACVIMWHITTEFCYRQENLTEGNDEREFSKILSDYMFYLLFNQLNVVSAVAGFAQVDLLSIMMTISSDIMRDINDMEGLRKALHNDSVPEGGRLLYRGIELAQKMETFRETKWTVMSGVWVEMLSYAAGHIKGEAHVQVLSKGGELLAFVWLLMAHCGCLYKPEWSSYKGFMFEKSETELNDDNGDQEEDEEDVSTMETEIV
ncbi:hypothetical protein ACJRO7_000164 [Eucalyptus globulus]|uniref:DUF4220 domain-containing protein n=1 Tax=Eucalyptus globulus TaxID=34317 RepID=A0ABD3LLN5_EUCGL